VYLPLYEMSLDDYLTIVRSFVKVFPNTALFFTGFDTILIGFNGDMALNAQVVRRNFEVPAVKKSLAEIGFTSPEMLLGMFVADLSQHPEFAGSGALNTDEHPIIEYSTPRSALQYTTEANQAALLSAFTPIPEAWLAGLDSNTAERLQHEHEAVQLMLQASVLRARNESVEAYNLLDKALAISPSNPVIINELVSVLNASAQNLHEQGEYEAAFDQFHAVLRLDPTDFWSHYYLIDLTMRAGDVDLAGALLQKGLERYPESPLLLGLQGKYVFTRGDRVQGLTLAGRAALRHPGSRRLWMDLSAMAGLAGDRAWQARAQSELDRLNAYIEGRD
jgi:tetratricopeptide (TPR) repeat protein